MATVDWARAERLYRQGEISVREIARREGVSEGAVRKRAKGLGWKRENRASVRSVVRTDPEGSPPSKRSSSLSFKDDYGPFLTGGCSDEEP